MELWFWLECGCEFKGFYNDIDPTKEGDYTGPFETYDLCKKDAIERFILKAEVAAIQVRRIKERF